MALLFNQQIQLLELTKLLERVPVDTLTSTYALGHSYRNAGNWIDPTPTGSGDFGNVKAPKFDVPNGSQYYKSVAQGELNLIQINAYRTETITFPNTTTIIVKNNDTEIYNAIVPLNGVTGKPVNGAVFDTLDLSNIVGTLTIEYYSEFNYIDRTLWAKLVYTLQAIQDIPDEGKRTVTDVINRVLDVGVEARSAYAIDGVTLLKPYYKLDPDFAEMFSKIDAPEYMFTRATLYEVLLEIGTTNNIGAIPKLLWDWNTNTPSIISFTLTGTDEVYTLPEDATGYLTLNHSVDAESYCGAIESYVENMVNTVLDGQGTVVEPSRNGYQTMRAPEGEFYTDDNIAQLNMQFPVYEVNKMEQGRVSSNSDKVGDITGYVFENAEYATLNSYSGNFPNSKEFAIKYTQGSNAIDGFTVTPETATILGINGRDKKYAAIAIAENQNAGNADGGIANFAYRVNYSPIVGARVRQYKPYKNTHPRNNILYYNQSANTVESSYMGNNMKYYLARIGNDLYVVTYKYKHWSSLPKIGQVFNDMYIAQVNVLCEQDFIVATLYLTPNFNRLNQNVGINSTRRQYEVSERQSVKRDINKSEFIIISRTQATQFEAPTLQKFGIKAFYNTFIANKDSGRVKNAIVQGFEKGTPTTDPIGAAVQAPILRSVASVSFGNSLLFYWQFKDNYGAGQQALYLDSAKKLVKDAPYGNYYGRFYWLKAAYYFNVFPESVETWDNQAGKPTEQGIFNKLPYIDITPEIADKAVEMTIAVDKDSREHIGMTLQYHIQAELESIVIGSELTAKNSLVYEGAIKWKVVLLPYRLNQLRNIVVIDPVKARVVVDATDDLSNMIRWQDGQRYITIIAPTNPTENTYKSWAIVNADTDELCLGENLEIAPYAKISNLYINF